MGSLLHKLWDETLAGPTPDSGLGKLRKYNSLSARSAAAPLPDLLPPPRDDTALLPISRKFTGSAYRNLTVSVDSPPSPSGSSAPSSPFSPTTPGGNFKKLARRKSASAATRSSEPKTPTGYDWIMLSALDR